MSGWDKVVSLLKRLTSGKCKLIKIAACAFQLSRRIQREIFILTAIFPVRSLLRGLQDYTRKDRQCWCTKRQFALYSCFAFLHIYFQPIMLWQRTSCGKKIKVRCTKGNTIYSVVVSQIFLFNQFLTIPPHSFVSLLIHTYSCESLIAKKIPFPLCKENFGFEQEKSPS